MSSSRDLYENNNPTLFSQLCEVSSGKFEPVIKKDKALLTTGYCKNPKRAKIITCKDADRDVFVNEVGGLELDIPLPHVPIQLPSYIPILDKRTAYFPSSAIPGETNVVGLTLSDIIKKGVVYKAGTLHEQKDVELRSDILLGNAIKGKRVILFPSGADTLIEWIWYKRDDFEFFKNLHKIGFAMTSGINFSVIRGECPFAQVLNQKRSLYSAHLASQAGIPVAPHIYAIDLYDIEAWENYLHANLQISLVTMNCQLQKSDEDIDVVIAAVSSLLKQFPYLHIILIGFDLPKIYRFGTYLARIHFADKVPAKYAQNHRKISLNLKSMKIENETLNENTAEILTHNIIQRTVYVELVKQITLERYRIPGDMLKLIENTLSITH